MKVLLSTTGICSLPNRIWSSVLCATCPLALPLPFGLFYSFTVLFLNMPALLLLLFLMLSSLVAIPVPAILMLDVRLVLL